MVGESVLIAVLTGLAALAALALALTVAWLLWSSPSRSPAPRRELAAGSCASRCAARSNGDPTPAPEPAREALPRSPGGSGLRAPLCSEASLCATRRSNSLVLAELLERVPAPKPPDGSAPPVAGSVVGSAGIERGQA